MAHATVTDFTGICIEILLKIGSLNVAQAGPDVFSLLSGITGVNHHTWLKTLLTSPLASLQFPTIVWDFVGLCPTQVTSERITLRYPSMAFSGRINVIAGPHPYFRCVSKE